MVISRVNVVLLKIRKNPDRCLPRSKAQSLSKGERASTAKKKKRAGSKGKNCGIEYTKGKSKIWWWRTS